MNVRQTKCIHHLSQVWYIPRQNILSGHAVLCGYHQSLQNVCNSLAVPDALPFVERSKEQDATPLRSRVCAANACHCDVEDEADVKGEDGASNEATMLDEYFGLLHYATLFLLSVVPPFVAIEPACPEPLINGQRLGTKEVILRRVYWVPYVAESCLKVWI